MVPTLYELANKALDEAFRLRCEYLLSYSNNNIQTPVEQNGRKQKILKRKLENCYQFIPKQNNFFMKCKWRNTMKLLSDNDMEGLPFSTGQKYQISVLWTFENVVLQKCIVKIR